MGTVTERKEWINKLRTGHWSERAHAAKNLASAGPCAAEDLIRLARSRQRDVRYAAVWALGQLHNQDALQPLCQATRDEDWAVREVAVRALRSFDDPRAKLALQTALDDEVKSVRCAASDSLNTLNR